MWGKKISAKQLKTLIGSNSFCVNVLIYDYFLITSTRNYLIIVQPIKQNDPKYENEKSVTVAGDSTMRCRTDSLKH